MSIFYDYRRDEIKLREQSVETGEAVDDAPDAAPHAAPEARVFDHVPPHSTTMALNRSPERYENHSYEMEN